MIIIVFSKVLKSKLSQFSSLKWQQRQIVLQLAAATKEALRPSLALVITLSNAWDCWLDDLDLSLTLQQQMAIKIAGHLHMRCQVALTGWYQNHFKQIARVNEP